MGEVGDDAESFDAVFLEVIGGDGVALCINGGEDMESVNVGILFLRLSVAGGEGATDDALESFGGGRVAGGFALGDAILDKGLQSKPKSAGVGAARENLADLGIVQQSEDKMLYGDEFQPAPSRVLAGEMNVTFQFFGNHRRSSIEKIAPAAKFALGGIYSEWSARRNSSP